MKEETFNTLDKISDIVWAVFLVAVIAIAFVDFGYITWVLFHNGLNAIGVLNGVAGFVETYAAIELCRNKWPFKKA